MINRWFHPPHLHLPAPDSTRKVGWLELFYDLVYVAAIIQLGNALSAHPDWLGFLAFVGVFTPIWLAWTDFTLFNNRFVVDDFLHRAMVFAQMFGIGAMAVAVPRVLEGELGRFVAAMAFVRLVLAAMSLRVWLQLPEARDLARRMSLVHGTSAVIWVVAALVGGPWNGPLIGLAVLVDAGAKLAPVRGDAVVARYPLDVIHLSERYGLLTLIVLGESFVKTLGALSDHADSLGPSVAGMAGLSLAITFALWWIYFDDVAGSRVKRSPLAGLAWVWAHLPLTLAITGVGVSVKSAVFFEPADPVPGAWRGLMAGSLGLALLAVAAIDLVTERREAELGDRQRAAVRGASAVIVGLVAVTGAGMPALTFVALLSGVCVLQVFADLMMSPLADPHAAADEDHALWDAPERGRQDASPSAQDKQRVGLATIRRAVRKGVPNEFRRDLYAHLMDLSWTGLFLVGASVWVVSNVFFGALYLLEPGSVSSVHDDHFLEAFSFSVQTMSSIGYGVMAPQTDYAHTLVAVEAFVGLVGIALATGLVFAKASRPSMSVMFSNVAVIHDRDGQPTLEFRVGNARGSEVVEASIYVVALVEEVTVEGHTLRRLHDLRLHRSMTPMFALSWSVMHAVDPDSPLHGLSPENCDERIVAIVCTLTGHDALYGQTTYTRHIYVPEDLRFDEDFVDVVSALPDGRLQVDFGSFHDTRPASH